MLFHAPGGHVIRVVLCTAAIVPTLLAACGEDAPVGEEQGESAPPQQEAPATITEADSGAEIRLPVGGETSLRLTSEYSWSQPTVRGESVTLTPVDYIQDPGFSEWIVTGKSPGEAVVAATGEPACAGQEGCDDAPREFQVTITVE
ncbi:MAG: hypothetical protein ACRDNI_00185 [Gaiellaceae bacterium]